jgi:hypothetical protein
VRSMGGLRNSVVTVRGPALRQLTSHGLLGQTRCFSAIKAHSPQVADFFNVMGS